METINNFFNEDDLISCYPLWSMLLIYIVFYILLAIYVPVYFKIVWSTPSMILLNIINIFIASMIFYSLCRSNIDGKKRITAMIILFYPVIIAALYFIMGITNLDKTIQNNVDGNKNKKNKTL